MDVDGKAFGGLPHGKRKAWEAGKIEPLRETHGVAIVVRIALSVVAGTVFEGWGRGNRGEKNRDIAELTEERGANKVPVHARFLEGFESDLRLGFRCLEICQEHRAELRFFSAG